MSHSIFSLTFKWTDASGTILTPLQYPTSAKNNIYTGVSLLEVSKSDWDSKKSFQCTVTHPAGSRSVNVQETSSAPEVNLLSVPKGDTQALVCTIENFFPKEFSVKWKKNGNYVTGSIDWDPQIKGDTYSALSVLNVKNTDWDSKAVYTCEVTHRQKTYTKKASKDLITVTLNQPSPKEIFSNNQAKLECVITGQDKPTVDASRITWQIDGNDVTNNIRESTTSENSQHIKTSTMTRSLTEWQSVNNVRCSATKEDMTPVIQVLTVHKGDGRKPKVTIHVMPENDIQKEESVTLVCLVSSPVQQDYYIAWSEHTGQKDIIYKDGINYPPQKTQNGYSVTSVYTTTKDKWNNSSFGCNVWLAGGNDFVHKTVSKDRDLITVTLNQPSPKEIFSNNQAKLECVITGQDKPTVDESRITWQIDGNDVTNNIRESTTSENSQHIKTSTMTHSLTEWQSVNNVRCSATKEDMTPVIQVLTVHKGDGRKPKVTFHVMPENDIQKAESVTLVCLVSSPVQQDYYIAWSEHTGQKDIIYKDGINYPPQKTQNGYSVTSVYTTTKDKWNNSSFGCNVWLAGGNDFVHKTVSKDRDLITVTLNQPSPKEIFSNNQARLECVITGQDKPTVDESRITWQIDGNDVTNNISESTTPENSQHIKTSTMTRSLTEWQSVNNVRCSATKEDMTPVIQVLTVHKGDGSKPKVTIHVMPENDIQKEESVTLVCLVSSPVQQDYYIAWSEHTGQKDIIYKDGINYPPQKTQNGYSVTSVYTTTKDKWNNSSFGCNVWLAGVNDFVLKTVSYEQDFAPESELSCALSCTDEAIEEDEFSSLWSTTSSFIFLFISSLFYSMIFSLVKMKRK